MSPSSVSVCIERIQCWCKHMCIILCISAGKRKYNRGRRVDGQWVFGGIERGSPNAFMVVVPDRSKNTLLPIIQQYIRPGTTIMSDEWAAYHDIRTIPGYTHMTVNH